MSCSKTVSFSTEEFFKYRKVVKLIPVNVPRKKRSVACHTCMSCQFAPPLGWTARREESMSFFSISQSQLDLSVMVYLVSGGKRSSYPCDWKMFPQKGFLNVLKSVLQLGSKLPLPLRSNTTLHRHLFAAPTLSPVLSTSIYAAAQLGRSRR